MTEEERDLIKEEERRLSREVQGALARLNALPEGGMLTTSTDKEIREARADLEAKQRLHKLFSDSILRRRKE